MKMRNRWGIEIKKGYHAWAHHPRGGTIEGKIWKIDRDGYVTFDSGQTATVDDVFEVLPPMRVLKGGVVKANPDEIHIDIGSHNTEGRNVRAKNPAPDWRDIDPRSFDTPQSVRVDFGDGPVYVVIGTDYGFLHNIHGDIRQWKTKAGADKAAFEYAERNANPTPRLQSPTQLSQRSRTLPNGKTTKRPSTRLQYRRALTRNEAPPGVWANPLTRVRVMSDPQRGGELTKRLMKRRKVTKAAPPGFYANPVATADRYAVQRQIGSRWKTLELFDLKEFALIFARAIHGKHPKWTIRVWDYGQ